jgi:hypothetical protein
MHRRLLMVTAAVTGTATLAASAALAMTGSHTVMSVGKNTMKRNAFVKSSLHWSPGARTIMTGQRMHWRDADTTGEPHIVLVVNKRNVPRNVEQVFDCAICNKVAGQLFSSHKRRLNKGAPGLNTQGDALLLLPGQPISARVRAKRGTVLHYVCAIHPWMQGTIKVT